MQDAWPLATSTRNVSMPRVVTFTEGGRHRTSSAPSRAALEPRDGEASQPFRLLVSTQDDLDLDTLVDADLANNTLGWQWSAGCGADAAPYFRVFNPITQGKKFDPDGA